MLAQKYLDENEYQIWNKESIESKLALTNREEIISNVDAKIETDLELIGSTGIEDKLQDEVSERITFMK